MGSGQPGEVDHGEEQIPQFFLERRRGLLLHGLAHFFELFGDFGKGTTRIGPVEADRAHALLDAMCPGERIETARQTVQNGALTVIRRALTRLQRFPIPAFTIAIQVRMAAAHFLFQ